MTISKIATSVAALITVSAAAEAATFYSDRISFITDKNPQLSEDFNATPPGSSFAGQELTIGNMTFAGGISPAPGEFPNYIAPGGTCVAPNFDLFEVDGSPYACGFVGSQANLRVDFLTPVTSWGADFGDLADETRHTKFSFYDADSQLISDYVASGYGDGEKRFLGFDLDGTAAGHMTLSFVVGASDGITYDVFGIDNVVSSTARDQEPPAPVPLPSSVLFLSGAGLLLAGFKRSSRNRTNSALI